MRLDFVTTGLVAALLAAVPAFGLQARDQIRIVGSSTLFPYTQAVAEEFAYTAKAPTPVAEATGTGGGLRAFCSGIGMRTPDITGASRAMRASEFDRCTENGVTDVSELLIGFDGISIARAVHAEGMGLTSAQLFLALAAEVPVGDRIVANPFRAWQEVDPELAAEPILVLGPPPTSGTRDAFVDLVMLAGCRSFPAIRALDPDRRLEVCSRLRQDGPYVEAGENDNLIVRRLKANEHALGIFGFSFLYENRDALEAVAIDGVLPSIDAIRTNAYPLSRAIYLYVKNAHRPVVPELGPFLEAYVAETALGPGGYLTDRGLIPASADERAAMRAIARAGTPMDRSN